ncbi:MAG: response regulator transcription factor [Chloroflexi bacterium]|nr:response regulator transcription factor [Chloroflexota bacterium]
MVSRSLGRRSGSATRLDAGRDGAIRVLILGRSNGLTALLQHLLQSTGGELLLASNRLRDLPDVGAWNPDLVLVECGEPHEEALRVCDAVARSCPDAQIMPVIYNVPPDGDASLILRFSDRASDFFVCHPCSPDDSQLCHSCMQTHLLPRLHVLLERGRQAAERRATVVLGDLEIDLRSHRVRRGGESVHLSPTEYRVLAYLASQLGRAVSRDELLGEVWGDTYDGATNVLDVVIHALRQKICNDPSHPAMIATVRGFGYRLDKP